MTSSELLRCGLLSFRSYSHAIQSVVYAKRLPSASSAQLRYPRPFCLSSELWRGMATKRLQAQNVPADHISGRVPCYVPASARAPVRFLDIAFSHFAHIHAPFRAASRRRHSHQLHQHPLHGFDTVSPSVHPQTRGGGYAPRPSRHQLDPELNNPQLCQRYPARQEDIFFSGSQPQGSYEYAHPLYPVSKEEIIPGGLQPQIGSECTYPSYPVWQEDIMPSGSNMCPRRHSCGAHCRVLSGNPVLQQLRLPNAALFMTLPPLQGITVVGICRHTFRTRPTSTPYL